MSPGVRVRNLSDDFFSFLKVREERKEGRKGGREVGLLIMFFSALGFGLDWIGWRCRVGGLVDWME